MKRILIVCAALLLCGVAAARERGVHRVASCNIRVALPQDEEGGNGWSARKYVCERVMKRCKADIYCLQEVTVGQYEDMCRMFPGYFVFGYPGPETDALPDREYHGIAKNLVMFSKRRYEMTGAGVYWLSDTPLVGGSSSWGTARPRHVNWVRLRDRRSGREFRVLSLHLDHISHEARLAQVRAVEEETSQYPAGVPQVLAEYCNQTPGVHINIVTDTIKNLYDMMRSYELDVAIVDGQFPASGYTEVLLDTDYLCLVVSPIHPLARRASVAIGALQGERFIMRPKGAGTRSMFESYLSECGADIRDFNIIIEMDSVATIKELVAQDLGISVIAHSACREDEQAGRLAVVPLEKPGMVRRINMVHHQDFSHPEILEELRRLYIGRR